MIWTISDLFSLLDVQDEKMLLAKTITNIYNDIITEK